MNWNRIAIKLIVGLVFTIIATVVYAYYTYGESFFNAIYLDTSKMISKIVLFFLVGYFIIGNSFAPGKKNTWK